MPSDPPTLDVWLTALLAERLGQCAPWPVELHRHVLRAAQTRGLNAQDYLEQVAWSPDDLAQLTAAATVGHTRFFRHAEHFSHLTEFAGAALREVPRLRVWSVGCSTGEEAWSIALHLHGQGIPFDLWASDVNPRAIEVARTGSYHARTSSGLRRVTMAEQWTAPPELAQSVRFAVSALDEPPPADAPARFDLLFCRNLLIYLSPERIAQAWRTFLTRIEPWGAVVVSPVESLNHVPAELERAGPLGWFRRTPAPDTQGE